METRAEYKLPGDAAAITPDNLTPFSGWVPPSAAGVKKALQLAGWSEVEYSRRIGVNDRTVRRWTSGEKTVPYAAWCILVAQAGLGSIWVED